nr:hypothetical protein [uncultured Prevotella sp.]
MIVSLPSRSVDTRRDLGAFDGEVLDFPCAADGCVAGVVEGEDQAIATELGKVKCVLIERPTVLVWYFEVCQFGCNLIIGFIVNSYCLYAEVFKSFGLGKVDGLVDGELST